MSYLKQSTTSTIKVGPILSATDLSVMTSATLTVKLAKNGGTLAARHSETAITHDADGNYTVELDATDSGTCGELTVAVTATGAIPWTKTYSIVNELAYTELMGNKHDAAMLGEAIRQGYDPDRDAIVLWADTDAGRGTNLKTAVAAVGALTPTVSKWGRVWIPPWYYKIETATLALDTNYVELRALFPEEGGSPQSTDIDYTNGTTSLSQFRPPRTLIYAETAGLSTVTQSAQHIRAHGFGVAAISAATSSESFHAWYVSAATNAGSVYTTMYYWFRSPYSSTRTPFGHSEHAAGLHVRNKANCCAFRVGYTNYDGVFSATMYDCEAGAYSYIGDYTGGHEGTQKASGCRLVRCKQIGSISESGFVYNGHSFGGCVFYSMDIDSTCYFEDCEAGDNSYGTGELNQGRYVRCRGKKNCFAGTIISTYPGEFAGYAEDCVCESGLGAAALTGGANGKLTGTIINCIITANEQPIRAEGATIVGCHIKTTTTDQHTITLLDSTSKIHNSTLLPVEGGTGVPIYAASALSVSAAGNTYGNKAVAANGLGANVTNLATIDVVPKVDLTTAATSVTNAVTTDSPSREASKADVSTLATSTELAASKTILDKFDSMIAEDS